MQFREGASVYTTENEKVGTIDQIVLDPDSKEITHVVVQKGFLFAEDKLVPVRSIKAATADRVTLHTSYANLEEFPDFEVEHYLKADQVVPSAEDNTHPSKTLYYYPPIGIGRTMPPRLNTKPMFVENTEKNLPDDTVAIDQGTSVVSSDGEAIGEVERIFSDTDKYATHLLVSEGLFLKEKKLIPTAWIKKLTKDRIRLMVDAKFIERLPEYQK
jgi:uncharacterized protein YrrD